MSVSTATGLPRRQVPGLAREVSALGAGCWTIGGAATNRGVPIGWDGVREDAAMAGLRRAHELGVTLFDTADVYGLGRSERRVGRLLREVPRERLVVSSKVGYFAGTDVHPYTPRQMRHQLDTTLANLGVDHLDLYCFHSQDFGDADEFLAPAVRQMRAFVDEGLVRAVGMRAPHVFAVEWADFPAHPWGGDASRFLRLFHAIRPEVVMARHHLLSPLPARGETDLFAFARANGCGVLVKQALGQGLLLDDREPGRGRAYGPGDHRGRDPMFRPEVLRAVHDGMRPVRERFGSAPADVARVALRYALAQDPSAAVLVGFRNAEQIDMNVRCLGEPLGDDELAWLRDALDGTRAAVAGLTAPRLRPAADEGRRPDDG